MQACTIVQCWGEGEGTRAFPLAAPDENGDVRAALPLGAHEGVGVPPVAQDLREGGRRQLRSLLW
eukprot:2815925-Alexandrium_andersonii.AAC.1